MRRRAGDIVAIEQHLPAVRLEEAVNGFEERGFTDAVCAKDRRQLPGLRRQAKAAKDVQVFVIADVEVIYFKHLVVLVVAKIGVNHSRIVSYCLWLAIGDHGAIV